MLKSIRSTETVHSSNTVYIQCRNLLENSSVENFQKMQIRIFDAIWSELLTLMYVFCKSLENFKCCHTLRSQELWRSCSQSRRRRACCLRQGLPPRWLCHIPEWPPLASAPLSSACSGSSAGPPYRRSCPGCSLDRKHKHRQTDRQMSEAQSKENICLLFSNIYLTFNSYYVSFIPLDIVLYFSDII